MIEDGLQPQYEDPDYTRILQKQDFFPKVFLIPSQIKLDPNEGIKVIKRTLQRPDKYEEERVSDILFDESKISSYKKEEVDTTNIAGHGLLSLFKRTNQRRIKLAICICVYSQPKYMLKNTIKGIQKSYKYFLQKAGILPHEIIITVIFDGIEKINNSNDQTQNMISFFDEIDMKNGFANKLNGKSLDQYLKDLEQQNFNLSKLQQQNNENFNLFTAEQSEELESKLFKTQYEEYIKIKDLLIEVEELKKKKHIRLDSLPVQIYKKYEEICKDFCVENNLYFDTQEEIQEYLENKKNIKTKLIYRAISETEILCSRYLDSRQDKVILYPVRLQTDDFLNPVVDIDDEQMEELNKNKKKEYNYIFMAVKYRNQGKLSSHMLFFEGFCKLFDPQYCILTDVGMKPKNNAVYKMWEYMELNPKCGGVCGYMNVKLEHGSDDLGYRTDGFEKREVGCLTRFTQCIFSIQRAQQFEYHYAHMLDKPFEAFFSYIHVLPGAFSAYRWKALKSIAYSELQPNLYDENQTERQWSDLEMEQQQDETIMKRYLKAALVRGSEISLEDSNMYLAEDRVMCLGIHALGYDIKYLPNVQSDIDPVTSLTRLLGQRRRWINGSWFAFNYVRKHYYERTSFIFLIQIIYYTFVQILSWVGPGLFYITMNLTLIAAVRQYLVPIFLDFLNISNDYSLADYTLGIFNLKSVIESIPDIINYVYIMLMFSMLLFSLMVNNNNKKFKSIYYSACTALGLYGIIVIALLGYNTYLIFFILEDNQSARSEDFIIPVIYLRAIILFIIMGHGLPILWSVNLRKYAECVFSLPAYIFYIPSYINLLQIFSFCRIDDLSWGTKGIDAKEGEVADESERRLLKEWERRKYIFILQYISTNVVLCFILIKVCEYDFPRNVVILATMILVAFLLLFRLIPALIYLFIYLCKSICGKGLPSNDIRQNLNNGKHILNILKQIQLRAKENEKQKVKKKKQDEYKQAALVTSRLLPKTLNTYGSVLRSRVTQHMLNNNIFLKKDIGSKKPKKRINLRKKLKIVEEASLQDSDSQVKGSKGGIRGNYDLRVPDSAVKDSETIKNRLKSLKLKKNNKQQKRQI